MKKQKKNQVNYRLGGLYMLPFVVIALISAYLLNAPNTALLSISLFGLGGSLVLLVLGKKQVKNDYSINFQGGMNKINKILIILLIIICLSTLLAVTNPDTSHFAEWAVTEIINEQNGSTIEDLLVDTIGEPVIRNMTEKDDYILFSIFRFKQPGSEEEIIVVGVLSNFFNISTLF